MASRPVQISIDDSLLERVDADPEARQKGRSAFIRSAILLYLRARERREVDDRIRRAYADVADEMVEEVEDLLGSQSWPAK